ncbi:hypothetical protein [Pseudomarimonas arenosa]|uniref:Uncharacterized protein n=1 Tax=Pseudomarimonas arenosa TaxID=2774145 RepID=A0AAW3ZLE1_9GAMM|nr:hypothetical protein [Pseudomarimonas arenosa]MBD8525887.1 hypothetical protein [Pseudomarimonas arenosa]
MVVSTGFDTVLEFDIERCELTMAWNAWEHGYNISPAGIRINRGGQARFDSDPHCVVVDNPDAWRGFGLPTGLTAAHLNNARYRDDQSFLVTLFHHGSALLVNRQGESREVLNGLLSPHGFEPGWQHQYLVTDTRRGRAIFLDESFEVNRVVSMDACPPSSSRAGLDEWLQNVLHLENGLYAAIDIHRSCIWLFQPSGKRVRRVEINPNWAVQNVIAVPPQHVKCLNRRLDHYSEVIHQVTDTRGLMQTPNSSTRQKRKRPTRRPEMAARSGGGQAEAAGTSHSKATRS